MIKTDGWPSYARAPDLSASSAYRLHHGAAHVVLPWVHRAFSKAKTWALGVYHRLRRPYLQSYLDEFVFRFNQRRPAAPPSVRFSQSPSSANR